MSWSVATHFGRWCPQMQGTMDQGCSPPSWVDLARLAPQVRHTFAASRDCREPCTTRSIEPEAGQYSRQQLSTRPPVTPALHPARVRAGARSCSPPGDLASGRERRAAAGAASDADARPQVAVLESNGRLNPAGHRVRPSWHTRRSGLPDISSGVSDAVSLCVIGLGTTYRKSTSRNKPLIADESLARI